MLHDIPFFEISAKSNFIKAVSSMITSALEQKNRDQVLSLWDEIKKEKEDLARELHDISGKVESFIGKNDFKKWENLNLQNLGNFDQTSSC